MIDGVALVIKHCQLELIPNTHTLNKIDTLQQSLLYIQIIVFIYYTLYDRGV